jgi:hypothetical protein
LEGAAVDRAVILSYLEVAERYVAKGEQYIERLREIIEVLARGGSDPTSAQDLLRQVETVQEMYVAHRDWLVKELKQAT